MKITDLLKENSKQYTTVSGKFRKARQVLWNLLSLKNKRQSNNPQLTKLMEEKLTFKELKQREFELKEEKLMLNAKLGHINNYQP
jgi:hypothetical protein